MFLLFDIGGTNMRFAISSNGEDVTEFQSIPTPLNFAEAQEIITIIVNDYKKFGRIEVTCGGIAGPLDQSKSFLVSAPHLGDWNNKPLKKFLADVTGGEVMIENDTALGGLGECVYGIGKSYNIVAYVAIGTGIGGAKISDKKIDENSFGFEPGHQIIRFNEHGVDYFEDLISGSAIYKKYKKSAKEITDIDFWEEMGRITAIGLNNVSVFWSPQAIILGGGIVHHNDVFVKSIHKHLSELLKIYKNVPEILETTLGDKVGLYGALALINSKQKNG